MAHENTAGRGVLAHYGPRTTKHEYGAYLNSGGRRKSIVHTVSWEDFPVLPSANKAGLDVFIPIGATIIEAYFQVTTAFAGSSGTIDIGLEEQDGTEVDDDGLFNGILQVDIDGTRGFTLLASQATVVGAILGEQLDVEAYLKMVVASGSFTAGQATVTVDYLQPAITPSWL